MIDEQEVLQIYENSGALLNGHFVLSSGRHSGRYLQSALVLMHPAHAERLGRELAAKVDAQAVDLVVSPALGGLIIGHEVARALGRPFIFTERKEGQMQLRRGFVVSKGARALVVEDVITTGGSVRECMQVVREHGGAPFQVLAVVDRAPAATDRFDVPFDTLIKLDVPTYAADDCPLCRAGLLPPVKPGSRGAA
jgi:orotate phosphoribosyltransferase